MANKQTKRCSTSLVILETQIKTTNRCHYLSEWLKLKIDIRVAEKPNHSYIAGVNVKQYSPYGKQFGSIFKN